MPSGTVEDYLKALFILEQESQAELVPMGKLAQAVKVTPGTATTMVKSLAQQHLVDYTPRSGVKLTGKGKKHAIGVLRRHRLVELFLVDVLGLDWSEVDTEAERLEHAISDAVLEKLDIFMGHPKYDPHGDPIPTAQGVIHRRKLITLASCKQDDEMRVARVNDQDGDFLRFIEQAALKPGTQLQIRQVDAMAQMITVYAADQMLSMSLAAAEKILVEPANS